MLHGHPEWTLSRRPPRWAEKALRSLWPDQFFAWNGRANHWERVKGYRPHGTCMMKYDRVGIIVDPDGKAARDIERHHFADLRRKRFLERHPEFRIREIMGQEKAIRAEEKAENAQERARGQAYWERHHRDYMRLRGLEHLRPHKVVAFQGAAAVK
jgi:hypothetical protein